MLGEERNEPVDHHLEEGETLHLGEAAEEDIGALTLHVDHLTHTLL